MIKISNNISLCDTEIQISAIRAQGPGGQHVNKTSTAVQLRFDIEGSTLPDAIKQRLLALNDYRMNKDGILIIKAQRYKSRQQNKQDALTRLTQLIQRVLHAPKKRKKTKPSKAAKESRLKKKNIRANTKVLRRKPSSIE